MSAVAALAAVFAARVGAAAYEVTAVDDGGTLVGRVRHAGDLPPARRIVVTKDAGVCGAEKTLPMVRVDPSGGLADVAVVVDAPRGKALVVPREPVVFDQRGCEYRPFVLAFPAGTVVRVLNPDGVLHNVHVMARENGETNRAMPRFQRQIDWRVERPEWPIPVKCDVHPWMSAYWLSMAHPYYAVTAADGRFSIRDLPAGDYPVDLWHPTLGRRKEHVTITAGEATDVTWSMGAD